MRPQVTKNSHDKIDEFLMYHTGEKSVNFNQKLEDNRSGKWQPPNSPILEEVCISGWNLLIKFSAISRLSVQFEAHMCISATSKFCRSSISTMRLWNVSFSTTVKILTNSQLSATETLYRPSQKGNALATCFWLGELIHCDLEMFGTSLEIFKTFSEIFGRVSIWSGRLRKYWNSRVKNLTSFARKERVYGIQRVTQTKK